MPSTEDSSWSCAEPIRTILRGTFVTRIRPEKPDTSGWDTFRTCHWPMHGNAPRMCRPGIHLGADPRAEENARKAVPTLTEFMEGQYFPHVATRKRTAAKDEEYYRLRLKAAFGHRRLNQITRREVRCFIPGFATRDSPPPPAITT